MSDHCRSQHPALPRAEFTGKKRIRSLQVLAHGARELEHGAAGEDALNLADRAALAKSLARFFPEENHNPYRSNGVYTTGNATCTGLRGENPQATFFLM